MDSNVIANLFTAPGDSFQQTLQTILSEQNKSRYRPPQCDAQYRSRESTVSLEGDEDIKKGDESILSYLQLSFNLAPKGSRGFEFGTDKNCDVVLPKLPLISRVHCAITFDRERRLILRDFSKNGTAVVYDGEGAELRKVHDNFSWILGGHQVFGTVKNVIIRIQGISFRIDVMAPENENEYNTNVDRFLQQAESNLPLGRLEIQTVHSTVAPSGAQTPSFCPIRIKRQTLGRGAWAVVSLYWDVSTGIEYAYKEPPYRCRLSDEIRGMWRKEAEIMRRISHEHVVELVEEQVGPWPRLILEYIPLGDLEGHTFSDDDSVTILRQGLSALTYLHELEHPVVHRDIKPGNILVRSRQPLHIKLSDFGLSKEGNNLQTFCGTHNYLAPEVYEGRTYTSAVDIWSLGVVVYDFTYGLPSRDDGVGEKGRKWCGKIVEAAKDCDSDELVDFLLVAMLVIHPTDRHSARKCYEAALRIPLPSQGRSLTPTPLSYPQQLQNSSSGFPLLDEGYLHINFVGPAVSSIRQDSSNSNNGGPRIPPNYIPHQMREEAGWTDSDALMAAQIQGPLQPPLYPESAEVIKLSSLRSSWWKVTNGIVSSLTVPNVDKKDENEAELVDENPHDDIPNQKEETQAPRSMKAVRTRRKFTGKELDVLEAAYGRHAYVDAAKIADISKLSGLSTRRVRTWFQNRRARRN